MQDAQTDETDRRDRQNERQTSSRTDRQTNRKDSSSGHGVPQDDRLTDGETDGRVPAQTHLVHTGRCLHRQTKTLATQEITDLWNSLRSISA